MVTVGANDSSMQADSMLKLVDLVQRPATTWQCSKLQDELGNFLLLCCNYENTKTTNNVTIMGSSNINYGIQSNTSEAQVQLVNN